MKKHIVIAVIATVFLGAAGFAEASHGDRGYRNSYNNGYSSSRHYRYDNRYRSHHNNRDYRNGRYNRHRSQHDHYKGLKIAEGAVVLGSLIHAIKRDRRERTVYRTRRVEPLNRPIRQRRQSQLCRPWRPRTAVPVAPVRHLPH